MSNSLAARARRATNLDLESFARLLGVPWREISRFEEGQKLDPLHEALFSIIADAPREAIRALERSNKADAELSRAIVQAVLALGKGPKKNVSLHVLKNALRFGKEDVPAFAGLTPEGLKETLYELDKIQHIELQAAVNPGNLSKLEKDACIRDARRGFLAYVAPGSKLPRKRPAANKRRAKKKRRVPPRGRL
jgi:hypothetical protein